MSRIIAVRVEDWVYDRVDKQAVRWKTTKQELIYAMVRENIDRWDKFLGGIVQVGGFKPREHLEK